MQELENMQLPPWVMQVLECTMLWADDSYFMLDKQNNERPGRKEEQKASLPWAGCSVAGSPEGVFSGSLVHGSEEHAPVNIGAEPGPPHEETCPLWLLQIISAVFQSRRA